MKEAGSHSGFILLVLGFFVCGLQVQFINTHLPAYLSDKGISATIAASAIATIGLFNMAGIWISGWLGGRMRMKYLLSYIYLGRAIIIFAFISIPISEISILVFAASIGLLWLATVPLTSGIVAQPRRSITGYGSGSGPEPI